MFEPELFDIYLSYCQKSSHVMAKTKPVPTVNQGTFYAMPGNPPHLSTSISSTDLTAPPISSAQLSSYLQPPFMQPLLMEKAYVSSPGPMKKVVAPGITANIPAGTTHIVTDKGGHTIYDSELKLLLDPKKSESQSKKFVEDFTTYKHGSFLLYSQRGLLETLPLTYTCLSVTGNATVVEPNIHTLPQVPEHHPSPTQASSFVSKTTGYSYPDVAELEQQKQEEGIVASSLLPTQKRISGSIHPIPQILTDIGITPKELMMQVESLKSGVAYAALLKFSQPVSLTDISIPATGSMSSVSVDVWLEPDGEKECTRVAQSSEIKTRSLMIGNLTPPPVCQYVKVCYPTSDVSRYTMQRNW